MAKLPGSGFMQGFLEVRDLILRGSLYGLTDRIIVGTQLNNFCNYINTLSFLGILELYVFLCIELRVCTRDKKANSNSSQK